MEYHPHINIELTRPDAVFPTKGHPSDAGYDLTIIDVEKEVSDTVTLFTTGVKIAPEPGYYVEIVPRSSIIKTGYMLANNIGIIDNTYRGNIMIALHKVNPGARDIREQLPFRGFQMITRKQVDPQLNLVESIDTNTSRGEGGFGSTGV